MIKDLTDKAKRKQMHGIIIGEEEEDFEFNEELEDKNIRETAASHMKIKDCSIDSARREGAKK